MTLSTTINRASYTGDGSTTAFAFAGKFTSNSDLKVYSVVTATGVATLKTITTDYTVSGAGNDAGGTVTFVTAPASTETVLIMRDPALTQTLDLVENDPLPAETLEDALDSLMIAVQRLDERCDRAMRLSDTNLNANTFDPTLPLVAAPSTHAGKAIVINSAGDGLDLTTLSDDATTTPLTTKGDIATYSTIPARLAVGSNTQLLSALSSETTGLKWIDGIPVTTKGDLFSFSTVNARLAVGTNGQRLVANSAQSTGLQWVYNTIQSKTAGYTATILDDVLSGDATSAGFTFTLPAASTATGKVLTIIKTDSSTNAVTIDGNSSETIGGTTTRDLKFQGETYQIYCDGSNWRIISHVGHKEESFYGGTITTPGSGETLVAKFATAINTLGAAVTYTAGNSTTGDKWTVNYPGLYFMQSQWGNSSAAMNHYIMKNATTNSFVNTDVVIAGQQLNTGVYSTIAGVKRLVAGDVIRVTVSSGASGDSGHFRIVYLGA